MEFEGQYLTYAEYKALGGTLDLMPFNLLEFEARKEIDKRTFGRLKNLNEQIQEVKLCENKLITTLKAYADSNDRSKSIISENTDGYSVSYAGITSELTKTQMSEVKNIIEVYLGECKLDDGTPYLYRG
jgi:hypothetical protein